MNSTITLSDIFVKKICEKSGLFITKEEIERIWVLSGGSKARSAYATSLLLGRKSIKQISQGLYKVKRDGSGALFDEEYWTIVEKLMTIHCPSGGIIGGDKALECHLQNYSIPDILIIYTRNTTKRVRIKGEREIHFRTLISGKKTGGMNLYRTFLDNALVFSQNKKLLILSLEGSLLDALSLRRHDTGIEESTILYFLKRYHMRIQRDKLGILVKYRYIRALNRLRVIARDNGYDDLYKKTLDVIRDEGGGCYINL